MELREHGGRGKGDDRMDEVIEPVGSAETKGTTGEFETDGVTRATGAAGASLRISGTHFPVRTLGPGRRFAVWLQGCALACPGCMSRHTWDPLGGSDRPVPSLLALWRAALAAGADGLTVSGGEPLDQPAGLGALLTGAAGIRDEALAAGSAAADLLLYTGYEGEEIDRNPLRTAAVRPVDALVTGRFRIAEPTALVWRGSANQRLRPRTELGRARYAAHLDRTDEGPRLQTHLAEGENDVRLYGVPLRGELAALERRLARAGIRLDRRSWRP
ncbi:4Fe-4S cluster-binding domain-containing protein [Streptomyces amakusaensis]|uniref:4Fe-4S cluster-binding domain-containing protein n=1 Tax=Streptomyces amakusaensis TaxID=67271 RepID=A0ABW0ARM8_9ACTN